MLGQFHSMTKEELGGLGGDDLTTCNVLHDGMTKKDGDNYVSKGGRKIYETKSKIADDFIKNFNAAFPDS